MSDDGGNGDYVAMSDVETIGLHRAEWRRVAEHTIAVICECGETAVSGSVETACALIRQKHRRAARKARERLSRQTPPPAPLSE